MTHHNPKFAELVCKLCEIFQIDRPELDFGIYRILNTRADEINDYLENRLYAKVESALSESNAESVKQLQTALQDAEKNAQSLGVSSETVPKVIELRAQLQAIAKGSHEHENAVFSHLLIFFSRYYDQGDFISQRRYKGDTYAIPYAGEEVVLHWANKDQYYTKSGEQFSNYRFKLADGRTVQFRLVAADTAKDNRKDNDKERRFALIETKTLTRLDDEGEETEETVVPVEECNGELILRFEYAAQAKGTKQETLVQKAVETVLADSAVKSRWLALADRAPTEKNPQRTLLEKHLSDYTAKNTADYFIHKDLGGFLRRELDFYIKNEVMHLDDVQNAGAFADIEKNLRMIQCLRAIALELISFLAQLEDFQKKLWLKKKFVVSSHYCITLDRVPEELYPEIVANEKQWAQWFDLGVWDKKTAGTLADLKAGKYRMVDTFLFDKEFNSKVISSFSNTEDETDGILIKSDSLHAIKCLQERYQGCIACVYLDPPYNTTGDGFLYRDRYQHSSWLSMLNENLKKAKHLLSKNAILSISLDENEAHRLCLLAQPLSYFELGEVVIHRKRGRDNSARDFSKSHDYMFFFGRSSESRIRKEPISGETIKAYKNNDNDPRGPHRDLGIWARGGQGGSKFAFTDSTGYHFSERLWLVGEETMKTLDKEKRLIRVKDNLYRKLFLSEHEGQVPESIWTDVSNNANAADELKNLFGFISFSTPKPLPLIQKVISINSDKKEVVLDFFAGSGTTAHATIALNRKDKASRKYILVEQGDYFDTVVKPRIQKVVYSADWKDGKPTAPETGISHCFKVLKLESYEDALNNLELKRNQDLLTTMPEQAQDDYLLHYMLDVESRGSLLSVEDFKKPFDYTLNIAIDSAGAYEPRKIDLVETFNYLIGLRVKHIDAQQERGFVSVTGTLPEGDSCLVLWRDCDKLDYEGLQKLCDKLKINPADKEYDVVYLNGDHNIPTVLTQTAEEGGSTRVLKLRQIEPEFLDRMFSVEDC